MERIYMSIPETARTTGLCACFIRKLVKEGKAPYIKAGKKFLINVPAMLDRLNNESR